MRAQGLAGAVRGRRWIKTMSNNDIARPLGRVQRQFVATRPNALWVADLTYVATWRGFVYLAFVIDVYARRIGGWRVTNSLRSDLALDALEQALVDRLSSTTSGLVHQATAGPTYVSLCHSTRLAEAGVKPSVRSVGDSCNNALAESIIGLFRTEVIWHQGPWPNLEAVEIATLTWVDWFNHRRGGPMMEKGLQRRLTLRRNVRHTAKR